MKKESTTRLKEGENVNSPVPRTSKIAENYVKDQLIEMKSRGEIFGFEKGSKGWDFTVHYSDKPDRHIEVKGTVDTNGFLLLSDFNTNFKDAKEMPSDWCLWIIVVSKEKRVVIGEI